MMGYRNNAALNSGSRIMELSEFEKCLQFLEEIGIPVVLAETGTDSFLPGLCIIAGSIIIDREKLKYPGDILHEAGHIAVVPSVERATLNAENIAERANREAEEMMAIAWSYAACVYLHIDPEIVFHDHGYKGAGKNIADNFSNKKYFGVPMLQWIGLTADEKHATDLNVPPYPYMIKWMRD
jgi:hypothetical protein